MFVVGLHALPSGYGPQIFMAGGVRSSEATALKRFVVGLHALPSGSGPHIFIGGGVRSSS
jgi:hypothetical protein